MQIIHSIPSFTPDGSAHSACTLAVFMDAGTGDIRDASIGTFYESVSQLQFDAILVSTDSAQTALEGAGIPSAQHLLKKQQKIQKVKEKCGNKLNVFQERIHKLRRSIRCIDDWRSHTLRRKMTALRVRIDFSIQALVKCRSIERGYQRKVAACKRAIHRLKAQIKKVKLLHKSWLDAFELDLHLDRRTAEAGWTTQAVFFQNYAVKIHKEGLFVVMQRKNPPAAQPLSINEDAFSPMTSASEFLKYPAPGVDPTAQMLAHAVPLKNRSMTVFIDGHGTFDYAALGGLAAHELYHFLNHLEQRKQRDLIFVNSCYVGGQGLRFFPIGSKSSAKSHAENRTIYVALSLGPVARLSFGSPDFRTFLRNTAVLHSKPVLELSDFQCILQPLAIDKNPSAQPQIRLPHMRRFLPLENTCLVYNLTLSQSHHHSASSYPAKRPLVIPRGTRMLAIEPDMIPFPIELRDLHREHLFMIYPRQPVCSLEELIIPTGSAWPLLNGLKYYHSTFDDPRPIQLHINQLTASSMQAEGVFICFPGYDGGVADPSQPKKTPFMGFQDRDGNAYMIDFSTNRATITFRTPPIDPASQGMLPYLFPPLEDGEHRLDISHR